METMAAAVNFGEEYKHMNKVASKLVHATAFSVLAPFDEGEPGHLKPILFNNGVRFWVEAFTNIRRYVIKNGVEPLPWDSRSIQQVPCHISRVQGGSLCARILSPLSPG
jgi:hypothetical protein